MGGSRGILVLVIIVGIGICAANPTLRGKIGGCAESVKQEVTPGTGTETIQGHPKVYVIRGEPFYHRRECPMLEGKIGVPTALPRAVDLHEPCPECDPPTGE